MTQATLNAKIARQLATELGFEIVKNQISKSKYDYQIVKDGKAISTELKSFSDVLTELQCLQVQAQCSSEQYGKEESKFQPEVEAEAIVIEETAPDTVELSLEEVEPPTEIEAPVILPTIVTSHLKPQFQPARIDLKQTTSQELKEQVLALLNLQTASQAAKWAKEQGMVVDLCYKSHWAAVLEKAQETLAVAA